MRIGIDLLWVKPQKSGGIESYIRNLLNGFFQYSDNNEFEYVLFCARDNYKSFEKYICGRNFELVICDTESQNVPIRIIWENINLNRYAKQYKVDIMFVPVYSKPMLKSNIKYVTTIHDLQALHYPEYFSKIKYLWLRFAWRRSAKTSEKVVAISNFVRDDIIKRLNVNEDKVVTIYNPIVTSGYVNFEEMSNKYKIEKSEYFYIVSSMHKHKNLFTILQLMKEIKNNYPELPQKLVISGIGGYQIDEFKSYINHNELNDNIILTGFISDEERNSLYKNAALFLFPSIFEGFGMPVIEALNLGCSVVTTNLTSIPEVSENKAIYVENAYDVEEWISKIKLSLDNPVKKMEFKQYSLEHITQNYLNLFRLLL